MEEKETVYAATFLDFPTITAQQKGLSRGRFYTKPEVTRAKYWFYSHIMKEAKECKQLFPDISSDAFEVQIFYYYPIKTRKLWGKYKTTRPDIDNQTKLLLDVLTDTKLFWADDSQVVQLHLCKRYEEISKVTIIINRIKET